MLLLFCLLMNVANLIIAGKANTNSAISSGQFAPDYSPACVNYSFHFVSMVVLLFFTGKSFVRHANARHNTISGLTLSHFPALFDTWQVIY